MQQQSLKESVKESSNSAQIMNICLCMRPREARASGRSSLNPHSAVPQDLLPQASGAHRHPACLGAKGYQVYLHDSCRERVSTRCGAHSSSCTIRCFRAVHEQCAAAAATLEPCVVMLQGCHLDAQSKALPTSQSPSSSNLSQDALRAFGFLLLKGSRTCTDCSLPQVRHVDLVDPSRPEAGWKVLPKLPREAGQPWGSVWQGPLHAVFGHHATRRLQVRLPDT